MRAPFFSRLAIVLIALLVAALAVYDPAHSPPAEAAFDPAIHFYTIETEHFRITYHTGIEAVGEHVADIAESIYTHMSEALAYTPTSDKTEIILSDTAESANGSASALPYNAVRLLVTSPEDFSPLGDVDDWYLELVTHEYTHVLHTDNVHGIPALVNAILGKTLAPNQVQPRWILEGYGVFEESARTSGGRLRNSMWNMFMRADILEDHIAGLDEISNVVRRWPQGNIFYLYGSSFIEWIAQTYGEDALRKVSRDYGAQIIPWGIQRTIRRATGKTYDELYPLWIAALKQRYGAQADAVKALGIREGARITHHGQVARYPRWIPKNTLPDHQGSLLYYRDDQHTRTGLYALDIKRDATTGAVTSADEKHADLIARTTTESFASFAPDGALFYSSAEYYRNYLLAGDIERVPVNEKSTYGTGDGKRVRMTPTNMRAADPTVSPDGRRIVFTQNHSGTRSIYIANIEGDNLVNVQPLAETAFMEQAFTPRFSPDGMHIAYAVWKYGGYRDIRYVDLNDNTWVDITNDRAVEGNPSFSADGRLIYFHSDRTGVMNVYAYEIATKRLKQVTNVINGAYTPEASPDGKTLAYVGYTTAGFDLFAMPIDESTWPDAPPYVDNHQTIQQIKRRHWQAKPYSPWHTIFPRRYSVQITPGSFGQSVIVTATGNDITNLHSVGAVSTVELDKPQIEGSLAYAYLGLPADFSTSIFRSITPRGDYGLGTYRPVVIQETLGASSGLSYTEPTAYDSRTYLISHSLARVGANLPMPIDKIDPYQTPSIPQRGLMSSMHFGYSFTNAERFLWSVGPENGMSYSFAFDFTDPILGSQFSGFSSNADFTAYVKMPWLEHHSLAMHAGGGTSGGNFPGRGAFFIGGFADLPLVDTIRDVLIQGGITLRGYPSVAEAGRSYLLSNAEYRFPIMNIDRGDSTLPIFLNRLTGAAFVDYGSAFNDFGQSKFKTGVGAELWSDWVLGYIESFTFRLGYAKGLASLGMDKVYFVAAVPY